MKSADSDGFRGIGGVSVAIGIGLVAEHLGMNRWEVAGVIILVGIGLPIAITGRLKNW